MIKDDFTHKVEFDLSIHRLVKLKRGGMYGSEAQIRSKETQSVRRQLQKWNVATCIYKVDKCKKAKSVFC